MIHLRVRGISKQYGSLQALDNVSFDVMGGEVIGITGHSGAGTSTLIRMLAGLLKPDTGTLSIDGRHLPSTFKAQKWGISAIHQEPELATQLSVTNNIFLGHEIGRTFLPHWLHLPDQKKMDEAAADILARLDADFIQRHEPVASLSSEHRQLIAIAHVMASDSRLILVDNPSFLLTLPYQRKLLKLIGEWQATGRAVVFASNNLDHLFAVADRILVLRDGVVSLSTRTDESTREDIVAALVGTEKNVQRTPAIWALDSYYSARQQAEMLRHNQKLLERDLRTRDNINRQLVDQLAEQVTALDRANLALQDAQRRLLTEREEERKHLAREIHDQAIQDLLSLNYQLEEVSDRVSDQQHISAVSDELTDVRDTIRTLVEDLRRICGDLRPPTIDSLGLDAALRSFTREWSRRTGIEVNLELEKNFGRLPETIELSIFRIVQEGLNNIWKHSGATEAVVSLRPNSPRLLLISISDNGHGVQKNFDLGTLSSAGHYGLLGISERVALLGGRLRYENNKQGGLLLQVQIPHPKVRKV